MSTPHTSRRGAGQPAPGTAKVAIAGSGSIGPDSMGTITQLSRWAEAPA
jgi:hypothetical protein